jgi:hypothetical protein
MTHKDYERMAYLLHNSQRKFRTKKAFRQFVLQMAAMFYADNHRFSEVRFYEAVYSPEYWTGPKQQQSLKID